MKRVGLGSLLMVASCAPAQEPIRVADARKLKEAGLQREFRTARLTYPPRRLYLRAFKQEGQLEVWVGSGTGKLRLFKTYPVLAQSGQLGPKHREGDGQVPEGFYWVNRFNPQSRFLLSLGLDYPNARDRALGEPKPGSDIFIHGSQVSIGCLAMGDDAIQEIYLLALAAKPTGIPVHIFPARMDDAGWLVLQKSGERELVRFWATLRPAYLKFERTRTVPAVRVVGTTYQVR